MTIPQNLPGDGFAVPLRAAFVVPARLPLFAIAHNSANPKLILYPDQLVHRVLARRTRRYTDIRIDVRQGLGAHSLLVIPHGGFWAFSGNVGGEAALRALVAFFEARGVPLSEQARSLLVRPS